MEIFFRRNQDKSSIIAHLSNKSLVLLCATFGVLFSILGWTLDEMPVSDSEKGIIEKINFALLQRHPNDTADFWRSLGSQTPKVLIKVFETSSSTYKRLRVLEAMGWFIEQPEMLSFLKNQCEHPAESVFQTACIRTLGITGGTKEGLYLSQFLKHDDDQVRLITAKTIKRLINLTPESASGTLGRATHKLNLSDSENQVQLRQIFDEYQKLEKSQWIKSALLR